MNRWYDIKAQANGRAQVHIYGEIGAWGISADQFRRDILALGSVPIDIHISSGGGSANDGIAMHTLLASLPDVHTYADAGVASAATLPFVAGKKRYMATGAALMIHNPWDMIAGDAETLRKHADMLDVATNSLAAIYAKATGKTMEAIKALMQAVTWFEADKAIAEGWATDNAPGSTAQANIAPGRYAGTPKNLIRADQPPCGDNQPKTNTMKNLTAALAKAGLIASADVAEEAAVAQLTANLKATGDAKAKLDGDLAAAQKEAADAKAALTSAQDSVKALAKLAVDNAVKAGQITDGVRAKWEESIVANPKASLDLLAGITPRAHGHAPLPTSGSASGPKNLTELCKAAKASNTR